MILHQLARSARFPLCLFHTLEQQSAGNQLNKLLQRCFYIRQRSQVNMSQVTMSINERGCQARLGKFGWGCHLVASLGKFDQNAIWWPVGANLISMPSGGQFGKIYAECHLVSLDKFNQKTISGGHLRKFVKCHLVVSLSKFDQNIWWQVWSNFYYCNLWRVWTMLAKMTSGGHFGQI